MEKKYELTDETIQIAEKTLHRIKALRDFGNVKAGDLGGFVESEKNLSHDGDCCVGGSAHVGGNAWVEGSACVGGNAYIGGDARVGGSARVGGNAWVEGNAKITDNALINNDDNYICIYPIGSERGVFTAYKNQLGGISCNRGCFSGTLEEFEAAVEKTHKGTKYEEEYKLVIELVRKRLG